MHYLGSRGKAVCGARSIGDDVMFCTIVPVIINTKHQGDVFILSWCADDDLLSTAFFNVNAGSSLAFRRIAICVGESTG